MYLPLQNVAQQSSISPQQQMAMQQQQHLMRQRNMINAPSVISSTQQQDLQRQHSIQQQSTYLTGMPTSTTETTNHVIMSDLSNSTPLFTNSSSLIASGGSSAIEDLYSMDDLLPSEGLTATTSITTMNNNQMDVSGIVADAIVKGTATTTTTSIIQPNYVAANQLSEAIRNELIQMESRFQFDSNIELSADQQAFIIRCFLSEFFFYFFLHSFFNGF